MTPLTNYVNFEHVITSWEQNAQAQKKLYNKIKFMPSKSSVATQSGSFCKQNVIYTNASIKV